MGNKALTTEQRINLNKKRIRQTIELRKQGIISPEHAEESLSRWINNIKNLESCLLATEKPK